MKRRIISNKYRSKQYLQTYGMLFPSIAGTLLFVVFPILWVFGLCVYRYNGFTSRFVGAYNFIRIFLREPDYWFAVLNTFILAIGKLIVELSLALVLAYILDKQIKFRVFFRAVFFLPTIISVAIIGIIFFFIFATYNGILNSLLMSVHIISEPINWFASKWKAMFILATASIWQNFGLNMVFFLTGLQSIPKEIYESANIWDVISIYCWNAVVCCVPNSLGLRLMRV